MRQFSEIAGQSFPTEVEEQSPKKREKEPKTKLVRRRFEQLWSAKQDVLEARELLLQAKALVLCALPYRRTTERVITRTARVGKDAEISVTFAAVGKDAELPFGADRALLGWIQTRAFKDGFIEFQTLKEFLNAFKLNDSGANYRRFRERVDRLVHLAISIEASSDDEVLVENINPIRSAYYPKTGGEAQKRLQSETTGQLLMIPERYGFRLDPEFWAYLQANPVPLPLALMRLFHSKPKAWDFAQFLLYRCYAAKRKSVVPWAVFKEQLGSQDKDRRRLKYTLQGCLREIKVIYPSLPAEFLPEYRGLSVAPWRPPRRG